MLGFAILAKIFEESGVPEVLPKFLPNDWRGPFILLVFVCVISSFLDNIAAALIVLLMLIGAIISNFLYDMPALGVWIAILIGAIIRPVPWKEVPGAIKGSVFLLSLVFCASLMPVEDLPDASWGTALALGFVSAVFDNIPLTKLCLDQGHYDWGMLAYTVGFGGSMIWFGSSAGVAITNKFPESRHVGRWVKNGWHVAVAYIIGFFVLYLTMGWEPADNREHKIVNCPVPGCPVANKPEAQKEDGTINFTRPQ